MKRSRNSASQEPDLFSREALQATPHGFHPAVQSWLAESFGRATEVQAQAWPQIRAGKHVLIAAPTGSGKTLAGFLAAIDQLVQRGVGEGLPEATSVVYVSPLKALSNDIQRNLEWPLEGIRKELKALGHPEVVIRTMVRTGDTPQSARTLMRRRPPHILVTTPESLYILLGSDSGREMLKTTRSVIVDEIHALAPDKRGAHLALSLERLEALVGGAPPPPLSSTGGGLQRIGISATQKPVERIAQFLVGADRNCEIVDSGHVRKRDLAIEVPPTPLTAVMSGEVWQQVYNRIAELAEQHKTTLVFVNTRRMAERLARHLSERLGDDKVAAHHGSLAKEHRLNAEQRLKAGQLKVLVATASMELGIDIGDVELVCQLNSPRWIAAFLQRVGRSGHSISGTPKGRLFATTRDDLVECAAILDAVRRGELDAIDIPAQPLDVLAQQIAAEANCIEWDEQALYDVLRRAQPYRDLTLKDYREAVQMLAQGFTTRRGQGGSLLHRDAINGRLRPKRGARLTAITSGGTIPDNADYEVVLEPESQFIGTVNEDFAIESLAGDIFQLGNHSYRIQRVERGKVRVEDAGGQSPTIPFWLGEGLGRSDELSFAVSRLRETLSQQVRERGADAAIAWLIEELGLARGPAEQLLDYLRAGELGLGVMPTQTTVVLERFFDESGGMQLVIHAPFGSRLNRAWGLALRKRFCRKFNFELQAAATEDAIVLSLSSSHSFPLEDVAHYLNAKTVRDVLVQALLAAPMFNARWRWSASIALALPRFSGGKKVPTQLQRMRAEDLIAAVFPDQIACAENLTGPREIPDHPLVTQTISDCLTEAMDIEGLERLLGRIARGEVQMIGRDLTEPSPFAQEVLNARPYAFLDDAPLEERRTQAVINRRWADPEKAEDLGRLDEAAIARVREEAWPDPRSADEMHDALMVLGFVTQEEIDARPAWRRWLEDLVAAARATTIAALHVPAERVPEWSAVFPQTTFTPPVSLPAEFANKHPAREDALREIVRGRLQASGPVRVEALAGAMGVSTSDIEIAMLALEGEGYAMRGQFSSASQGAEWCERSLLARIHRYTVNRLRAEIEPVAPREFMCFLLQWQRVTPEEGVSGPDALAAVIGQLEGFEAPAAAWEAEILPARVHDYDFTWLDSLCLVGRVAWTRLSAPKADAGSKAGLVRASPIALVLRRHASVWRALSQHAALDQFKLSARARTVVDYLGAHRASFFDDIQHGTQLLHTELEEALAELTALGLVHADGFNGLRALLVPSDKRKPLHGERKRGRRALFGVEDAGRWTLSAGAALAQNDPAAYGKAVEHVARTLLKRYGVVFWRLLEREADWLPPWRDLVRCLRRLEARGEVRGGRFVQGQTSEQFALPEAVTALRQARRGVSSKSVAVICAADPLNLLGGVLAGPKVPAIASNRIALRDGLPVAVMVAGEIRLLEALETQEEAHVRQALTRRLSIGALAAYL